MNDALRAELTALAALIRRARDEGDHATAAVHMNAARALRIANGC